MEENLTAALDVIDEAFVRHSRRTVIRRSASRQKESGEKRIMMMMIVVVVTMDGVLYCLR